MLVYFESGGHKFKANLLQGIDISIPLISGQSGPKCFYAPDFVIEPVVAGQFIGDTLQGSPVNFKNLKINPHGNGTHTECVGHISKEIFTINQCLSTFHFIGRLITIQPLLLDNGDQVITSNSIKNAWENDISAEAMVIRTLPNCNSKMRQNYSGTNPPYFDIEAMQLIVEYKIQHLLVDLPSVDREVDGGKVQCHHIFWSKSQENYHKKTITEMVYIDNVIQDGLYLCQIQIAPIESDASPSKVILYEMVLV